MMRKLFLAAVLVLMASGAQAATLNVVDGVLHGAYGVVVDGTLYDVEFVEGFCNILFTGCDEDSDFTFDRDSAPLAAQALLDQVFIDGAEGLFDTDPELTNGCPSEFHPLGCRAYVPWQGHLDCGAGLPCFYTSLSDNRPAESPTADHITPVYGGLP